MHPKSFFDRQTPALTLLYNPSSVSEMLAECRRAEFSGADAIAWELGNLPLEERTAKNFRMVMDAIPLPFMFVLYRNDKYLKDDDEARQQYLLTAAEAGAEVIDVMGDLYAPAKYELTFNAAAIKKQKVLIKQIHARGAKVIMSSHMSDTARSANEVLKHLQEQAKRGADIVKIVTGVNSEEELLEAIKTTMLLNRKLDKPFVHLCNGKFNRLHRYLSPMLGSAIAFVTNPGNASQPPVTNLRTVLGALPFHIDDIQKKKK